MISIYSYKVQSNVKEFTLADIDLVPQSEQKIGSSLVVVFDAELSTTEEGALTMMLSDSGYSFISKSTEDDLEYAKRVRKDAVDARSRELLAEGFTYDGEVMSLSMEAQANAESLHTDKDALTYPVYLMNKGDTGVVSFADATELSNYRAAGVGRKMQVLVGGSTLKMSIHGAIDQSAVDAIEDTRT